MKILPVPLHAMAVLLPLTLSTRALAAAWLASTLPRRELEV